jgi:hypothetical protein
VHESRWYAGLENYARYAAQFPEGRIPQGFVTPDGYPLGAWANTQRQNRGKLSKGRKEQLDALSFPWSGKTDSWSVWYELLGQYRERFGDCLVPAKYVVDELRLGGWVREQRLARESITPERRKKLDSLGFVWDVTEHEFEVGLVHLTDYKAQFGDCNVPNLFRTKDGFKLGSWVANRRQRSAKLSQSQRGLLDSLGFSWKAKRGPRQ